MPMKTCPMKPSRGGPKHQTKCRASLGQPVGELPLHQGVTCRCPGDKPCPFSFRTALDTSRNTGFPWRKAFAAHTRQQAMQESQSSQPKSDALGAPPSYLCCSSNPKHNPQCCGICACPGRCVNHANTGAVCKA